MKEKEIQSCPTPEELDAFLRSVHDADEHETIVAHLSECAPCRRRAEQIGEHAAWGDDLRWVSRVRAEAPVEVNVPLERLNQLLPEYEVRREIGRGGMGIVFEALHRKLNRRVALKVLPALLGAVRPDAKARFRREAELAAGLEHTNIIGVYDFGEVDGTLYYAMQLIEGRSLGAILHEINETGAIDVVIGQAADQRSDKTPRTREANASAPSSNRQSGIQDPTTTMMRIGGSARTDRRYYRCVAEWIADVAGALDYAHEQGVIHRDIKPTNLLLSNSGRMMISDFGLARVCGADSLTASRALLGTARYMSPEQVDESVGSDDRRTDVYSLGATMYELLAFRPMFAAADDRHVLDEVLNKEPAPARRFVRQVPRDLETICLKAVEKQPEKRYPTAKSMAEDLRRWLLDLPIEARRPSPVSRAIKLVRRRKVPSALAAALLFAVVTTGVFYGRSLRSHREAVATKTLADAQAVRLLAIEARALRDEGRYGAALTKVEDGLARQPEDRELEQLRANMFGFMGQTKKALRLLEELVARDPDYWPAHFELAKQYGTIHRSGESGRYTDPKSFWEGLSFEERNAKAALHLSHVQRLRPKTSEAYYLRARLEPDHDQAIQWLNQADDLEPNRIDVVIERARRYGALGQYDSMLLDTQRAVTLQPGWSHAHKQRARAFNELGRHLEAVEAYSRAIELDPANASYWHNRGWIQCQMGRFAEAIVDETEAIRLDPTYTLAYIGRSSARLRHGEVDLALADCNQAIEFDPTEVNGYKQRAFLYGQAGRWDDVVAECGRVIALAPEELIGYQNRAIAYHQLGRYEQEIADLSRYIELKPDDDKGYRTRAVAYGKLSDTSGSIEHFLAAIADLTKALDIKPQALDYDSRANCHVVLGRFRKAIPDYSQVVESDSKYVAQGLLKRGMVYEMLDATGLALADYAQAATLDGPIADYATLWRYILLRQSGQDQAAKAVLGSRDAAHSAAWIEQLFGYLAGVVATEQLLEAAATDGERAEAYYYVARKAMFDGEHHHDKVSDALAKCVALDPEHSQLESYFAQALLLGR